MNLTNGKIVAGERLPLLNEAGEHKYAFTVETDGAATVTIGEPVTTFSFNRFDVERLEKFLTYLEDCPALMDEKEVRDGVHSLNFLLGKPKSF